VTDEKDVFYHIKITPLSKQQIDDILKIWEEEDGYAVKLTENHPLADQGTDAVRDCVPLRSVLMSVRHRWGAVIISESPYLDLEFWHSHWGLYEWCFKPYKLYCQRLHFFASSKTINSTSDYDESFAANICEALSHGGSFANLQKEAIKWGHPDLSYVGYSVLRPIPKHRLSRTAIKFDIRPYTEWPNSVETLEEEKQNGHPVLCISKCCHAHLLNARIKLRTPEFIQQDPHLGACATASMWVATTSVDTPPAGTVIFPYTTITRQAHSNGGYGISDPFMNWDPAAGDGALTLLEMRRAIEQCGWHMGHYKPRSNIPMAFEAERMRFIIHSHLESKQPVLLCATRREMLGGHTVAAVGQFMTDNIALTKYMSIASYFKSGSTKIKIPFPLSDQHYVLSAGTQVLYAHDDAYGPFNRVKIPSPKEQERITVDAKDKCPIISLGRHPQLDYLLNHVVVPLPLDVRTAVDDALDAVLRIFVLSGIQDVLVNHYFLWRGILLRGSDFKRSLRDRGYSLDLIERYATLHLPKYVWLYEVTIAEQNSKISRPTHIDGEYIVDATSPKHDIQILSERITDAYREHTDSEDGFILLEDENHVRAFSWDVLEEIDDSI
jgi:hypothetical protein